MQALMVSSAEPMSAVDLVKSGYSNSGLAIREQGDVDWLDWYCQSCDEYSNTSKCSKCGDSCSDDEDGDDEDGQEIFVIQ